MRSAADGVARLASGLRFRGSHLLSIDDATSNNREQPSEPWERSPAVMRGAARCAYLAAQHGDSRRARRAARDAARNKGDTPMGNDTKHTPGPWRFDGDHNIYSETAEWAPGEPLSVVNLFGSMGGDNPNADAHLMASAPELLEALRELIAYLERHWPEVSVSPAVRAAIAKATDER